MNRELKKVRGWSTSTLKSARHISAIPTPETSLFDRMPSDIMMSLSRRGTILQENCQGILVKTWACCVERWRKSVAKLSVMTLLSEHFSEGVPGLPNAQIILFQAISLLMI